MTVTILAWVPMHMVVPFAEIKIESKEEKVFGERKCTELSFRHMLFNGVTSYPGTDSSRRLAVCVLDMVCLSDCLISSHFNSTPVILTLHSHWDTMFVLP